MAFGTTAAGTITKEQTLHSIRRLPIAASTLITKGNVLDQNTAGDVIVSVTGGTVEVQHFVALETVDNSSGSAGDLSVPCAVRGHFVTVIADGVIEVGEKVVASGSTAGQVIAYVAVTHTVDEIVGVYWGKEGGSITKAGGTPFLESFTDNEDFEAVASADGDVVEIELR